MNRTDRLVALVMMLQSRRVTTAAEMAAHFEITERTVYRDIAALGESGVPVVGEPGVGYSLMRGYHLPPVMFSPTEAFALVTGGLLTERMTDGSMRESIRSAIGKVTAVLPSGLQSRVDRLRKTIVVGGRSPAQGTVPLSTIQQSLAAACVLRLSYRSAANGELTARDVEPLGLVFYLDHWHLIAWCRLRDEVRDFRVDRIQASETLTESVPQRPGFTLAGYLATCMSSDHGDVAVIDVSAKTTEAVRRYWGPSVLSEQKIGAKLRFQLVFRSAGLEYVARWILSLADTVEIIEPEALRKKVVAVALITAKHHQSKKQVPKKHS